MGPMCFDYGFGPFRWVCASGSSADLEKTDAIACKVLEDLKKGGRWFIRFLGFQVDRRPPIDKPASVN